MAQLGNLSLEVIILILRIAVVALLYLFLYRVLRAILRELRTASTADTVPASEYGYLVVLDPGQTGLQPGKRFPLNQINTIGRAMTNDIPLNDTFLSSSHAMLQWDGTNWVVEDVGSTNGTWIGGQRIAGPTAITYGDVIQLGRIGLRLSR
jgi:pSer/pThr/pTyr-binding forkhead associated (FHA) protein